MQKPKSLSIKDYLIRKMSVKTLIPEQTIDNIITHQFKQASEAMLSPNVNSVEISGFGKFLFNRKKAYKKLEKMYSQKTVFGRIIESSVYSDAKKASASVKLANTIKAINGLKPKLDETDCRRLEEQSYTTKEFKETN